MPLPDEKSAEISRQEGQQLERARGDGRMAQRGYQGWWCQARGLPDRQTEGSEEGSREKENDHKSEGREEGEDQIRHGRGQEKTGREEGRPEAPEAFDEENGASKPARGGSRGRPHRHLPRKRRPARTGLVRSEALAAVRRTPAGVLRPQAHDGAPTN